MSASRSSQRGASEASKGVGSSRSKDTFGRKHFLDVASYDSDDALSIPSSFTRSAAPAHLSLFSDETDDERLDSNAREAGKAAGASARTKKAGHGRGMTDENWDGDFDFSVSNPAVSTVCRQAEERSSLWDSDGSQDGDPAATRNANKSVTRSTSNRTIVAAEQNGIFRLQAVGTSGRTVPPPVPDGRRSSIAKGNPKKVESCKAREMMGAVRIEGNGQRSSSCERELPISQQGAIASGKENAKPTTKKKASLPGSSMERLLSRVKSKLSRRLDKDVQEHRSEKVLSSPPLKAAAPHPAGPTVSNNTFGRAYGNEVEKSSGSQFDRDRAMPATKATSFAQMYASSEQRQWASKLQDEPRERSTIRQRRLASLSFESERSRRLEASTSTATGKETAPVGSSTSRRESDGQKAVGPGQMSREVASSANVTSVDAQTGDPVDRRRFSNKRSFSGSTTASVDSSAGKTTSVSSAAVTDVSLGSFHGSLEATRQSPRQSNGVERRPPDTGAGKLSSGRGPPPVSSGIDSLSRRRNNSHRPSLEAAWAFAEDPSSSFEQQRSPRRDSGALRIPTRISKAQDALKSDLVSIRKFAKGIEDLEKVVERHQSVVHRMDSSARMRKPLRKELEQAQYSYATWWECAEVLLGLAKGREILLGDEPVENSSHSQWSSYDGQVSTCRRGDANASNSRASSTASRFISPERERSILAAMLAGAPLEDAKLSSGDKRMSRVRTVSGGATLAASPSSNVSRTRNASQRPSIDNRRTSEPSTSIQNQPDAHLRNAIIPPNTSLHCQDGRRILRGAGESGLNGLRTLISALRLNSTISKSSKLDDESDREHSRRQRTDSQRSVSSSIKTHNSRFWRGLRRSASSDLDTSQAAVEGLVLSNESQWTDGGLTSTSSDSAGTRRLLEAGRQGATTTTYRTASSSLDDELTNRETFRTLAMRPEAMPSLNRYLELTLIRCRECLTFLCQLEERGGA